ncbi:cell wall-associated NlpC family hydrolase [Sphingomonas zeicaulis]|uniref:C40 family peptidase n=1 Tax=Sphingomonas zeicaulis TaxID=1632740 RepID=UPI003D1F4299
MMMVATVAHLPLYDRPGPAGRQTSELLLGEHFAAIDIGGGWAWGYCAHDHYVGYVALDGLGAGDDKAVRMSTAGNHADPAALAQSLIGTPFLTGGRSGAGVDAGGLIQIALAPFGAAAPRDVDLQRSALGTVIDDGTAVRNDLVFVAGHAGIMADSDTLIHASGSAGAVVAEPLADVLARLGSEDLLVRRLGA